LKPDTSISGGTDLAQRAPTQVSGYPAIDDGYTPDVVFTDQPRGVAELDYFLRAEGAAMTAFIQDWATGTFT
jgi:hypothetical protein